VDTLETAVPWGKVSVCARDIKQALNEGLAGWGERVVSIAHLSHVYTDGASIYVTYLFRRALIAEELLERWAALKRAASLVIVRHGGTISHQHGVGTDHAPYLQSEKSEIGMSLLRGAFRALDPDQRLNPGKLLTDSAEEWHGQRTN
jgi:alkyldihydroxyacetonephosphate synthase